MKKMESNTNLNGETTMSTDSVDFLSNEIASGLTLRDDDDGRTSEDSSDRLDSNEPMSTDGKISLKSSDSDFSARGPQRPESRYANRDSHPYAYSTATRNGANAVMTGNNNQGIFSNAFSHQSDFLNSTMFGIDFGNGQNQETSIADRFIEDSCNNQYPVSEPHPDPYPRNHVDDTRMYDTAKYTIYAPIELSPEPPQTSHSSGYVSSQDQSRCESASMPSADYLDEIVGLLDDYPTPDVENNSPLIPPTTNLQNCVEGNTGAALFSTVSTLSANTTHGLEWPRVNAFTERPPAYFGQNNGANRNNSLDKSNVIQTGQLPGTSFSKTNTTMPQSVPGYFPNPKENRLIQPQSNVPVSCSRSAVNGTLTWHVTEQAFHQGTQLAMNMATPTDMVFFPPASQESYNQTNPYVLANLLEVDPQASRPAMNGTKGMGIVNAPLSHLQQPTSNQTSGQMVNVQKYQQQQPSKATPGQTAYTHLSNPQTLISNGTSGQIANPQQYQQLQPLNGTFDQMVNAPLSYPQTLTSNGTSGQMTNAQLPYQQAILYNRTSGQVNAETQVFSVNQGSTPGRPLKAGAMIQLAGEQIMQLTPNMGQYNPPGGVVAHLNSGQPVPGMSQVIRHPSFGKESVAGLKVPEVFVRAQVFQFAATNSQAGQRLLLPKHVDVLCSQQSSVSVQSQQSRKKRGVNMKRQRASETDVAQIPNITERDENGDTRLHFAACKKEPYYIKALLDRLEKEGQLKLMDCGNNKGQTPLYLAVCSNLPGIVSILVEKGADPNVLAVNQISNGTTESKSAIHVASMNKKELDYRRTLTELLKSQQLRIINTNSYGQTALHCAIQAQYVDPEHVNSEPTLRLLLDANAEIRFRDKDGLTPLMYAVKKKQVKLVKFLINYFGGKGGTAEAIVKDTDYNNITSMDIAAKMEDTIGTEIWNILSNACTQ